MKKIQRIIHIGLRQPEIEIVDKMEEKGYELSEIVRGLIREWGEKTFPEDPAYVRAKKEELELKKKKIEVETMSPEEYAEKVLHFKVKDGRAYHVVMSRVMNSSLTEVRTWKPDEEYPKWHNDFINNRPTFHMDGSPMTEKELARRWEEWEAI
jgi:hypothetical protein